MAVRGRGQVGRRPPPTPQNIPTDKLAQAKRGFVTVRGQGGVPTVIQSQSKRPPKPSPTKTNGGLFGGFFEGFFGTPTVTTPAPKAPTPSPQVSTPTPSASYTPVGTMSMQGGTRGQPNPPTPQKTFCMVVYGQQMQLTGDAINWYIDNGVDVRPCGEVTPTPTSTGSGLSDLENRIARLEKYPQVAGTASQKSDQDIWDHLDEHVWSNPPFNNPNAIYPQLQKVIATQQSLGDALQSAYEHRLGIEQKVDVGVAEHQDFHTKLQGLGDSLVEAKEHRDSLEKKLEIQRKHTHGKPPDDEEDCGWFGEKCWFKGLPDLSWLKWVLLAIGIGVLLWLLRPIFNLIGIFKGGAV